MKLDESESLKCLSLVRKVLLRPYPLDLPDMPCDVRGQEQRPLLCVERSERGVLDDVLVTWPGDSVEKRQRLFAAGEELVRAFRRQPPAARRDR